MNAGVEGGDELRLPALARFRHNLRQAPRRFVETMFRSGAPASDRTRSTFVFGNVFLHLHPARTHRLVRDFLTRPEE